MVDIQIVVVGIAVVVGGKDLVIDHMVLNSRDSSGEIEMMSSDTNEYQMN